MHLERRSNIIDAKKAPEYDCKTYAIWSRKKMEKLQMIFSRLRAFHFLCGPQRIPDILFVPNAQRHIRLARCDGVGTSFVEFQGISVEETLVQG